MQGGPFGKGLDTNELLLKRAHVLRDVSKLAIVVNYVSRSSFTTRTFHLEGEEVFVFTKCNVDFSLGVNDESHRLDCMNFSYHHVAILTCYPNNVDNLHIHVSPCVTQNMFPILSQGDIVVNEIMCGDGLCHIDWCHFSFIVQCSTLPKNIGVKCIGKINTHKTIFGTSAPWYFGFWAQF